MERTRERIGFRSRAGGFAGALTVGALLAIVVSGGAAAADPVADPTASSAVWPINPHPVVAPFDPPDCAYCAGHRGIDLGALPLTPVRAALSGRVTYAGDVAGRGVIVIDDGVRRTTYEPVTATVSRGSDVGAGDVIGVLDVQASHCFPDACLHFGLIDDASDSYLDPLTLFGPSGPVRLLPLWIDQPVASTLGRLLAAP